MKALVVSYTKMKGFGGGVFAARSTVNAVAEVCDGVTLLFPADKPYERDPEVHPSVRQIGVTDSSPKLIKLFHVLSRGVMHRYLAPFGDLLDRERFDLVVFHNSKGSRRLVCKAREHGAKVVTVHDNYEYEYTKDNFHWYELLWMLPITVKGEREAVQGSDLNLVLSVQDRDLLRNRYDPDRRARFEVLGVFEYNDRPLPELREPVQENVFAITGNLGTRQTLDSLLPWLDKYWPVIRNRIPDSRLLVAGKKPSVDLKKRLRAVGAELVDSPADMDEILRQARYYVCPTCKGGGVKLRVMDGLRFGLPCLVHEISARGYEPFRDRNLFAYDCPESFRNALESMLDSSVDRTLALEAYSAKMTFCAGVSRMKRFLSGL